MSDCAAEGELYRAVWRSTYDLRNALLGEHGRGRFPHDVVERVNDLLADLGWRLQLARYAEPRALSPFRSPPLDPEKLWDAVAGLRRALRGALRGALVGHRGWSPCIDPEVDYSLTGTGYELVQFKKVWLASDREP